MTNKICNEQEFSNWLAANIHILAEHTAWDFRHETIKRERRGWDGAIRVDLFCEAAKPGDDEPFNVIIEKKSASADVVRARAAESVCAARTLWRLAVPYCGQPETAYPRSDVDPTARHTPR